MTAEMLIGQFNFSGRALRTNTVDLTHRETCLQPSAGGNCINWIAGHILANRNAVLRILGEETIWSEDEAARYARGSEARTDPERAIPFERILEDLETSLTRIAGGLERLGAVGLAQPAPSGVTGGRETSIGAALAIFLFHEAYHVGQTGILRRLIGKEGAIP